MTRKIERKRFTRKNVSKGRKGNSKNVKRRTKIARKRGGSSYNMPLSYFGKPRQSSYTMNPGATTSCKLPTNSTWNCFNQEPKFVNHFSQL